MCAALALALSACPSDDETPDAATGPSVDARPTSTVDAGTNPTPDAPATQSGGWRSLPFPGDPTGVRVTAIHCSSVLACVVGTDPSNGSGKIYAASSAGLGDVVLDAADVVETAAILGDISFLGFETTHGGLVARIDNSKAYVSATGDFTKAASWTFVKMGTAGGESFAGNAQEALRGDADDHWLLINHVGYVYGASSAPSAGTDWTKLWSPTATPAVPEDFEDRYAADGTLCDSDVSTAEAPAATQNVYISADLGLAMFPAGGLNQTGTAKPGVCISTDRGVTFYNVPFADLAGLDISAPGPIAVTCLDDDDCFAYNGVDVEPGSVYLYYTNNASAGKASEWHRAALPAGLDAGTDVNPHFLFFAPDKMHGWLAGANDEHPMLLATTDGGHTWTNESAAISALTDQRLHSGFAVDADHVFLGGEDGTLLYTDTASH